MTVTAAVANPYSDAFLVSLARELAIDHYPVPDILKRRGINTADWERITENPRFIEVLKTEQAAWRSAMNTPARIRLKSAAVVEEFLIDAYKVLTDPKQALNHKVALLTQLGKFAALEVVEKETVNPSSGVTININIGDTSIQFTETAQKLTSEVIEGEVVEEDDSDFDWDSEFEPNPIENADLFFEDTSPLAAE